jgi:hypothetical protein
MGNGAFAKRLQATAPILDSTFGGGSPSHASRAVAAIWAELQRAQMPDPIGKASGLIGDPRPRGGGVGDVDRGEVDRDVR